MPTNDEQPQSNPVNPIAAATQTALQPTHISPDTGQQIAHDGTQWVDTQTGQSASVPMMTSDGSSVKMVPHDQADAYAAQEGMKPATKMIFGQGQKKWVPTEHVDDYRQQGGVLIGAAAVPKPAQPDMQESQLAHAASPTDSVSGPGEGNFVAENPDQRGTLAAAAGIGAGGALGVYSAQGVPALYDVAIKHLAGNVLPGMEAEAAKQTLIRAIPQVVTTIKTLSELGIGLGGITYLIKALTGGGKN